MKIQLQFQSYSSLWELYISLFLGRIKKNKNKKKKLAINTEEELSKRY